MSAPAAAVRPHGHGGGAAGVGLATRDFIREHLRERVTVVMMIVIPALFVLMSASVLEEFSNSLGGSAAGVSATALGAGWAAGFLGGILGFFQVSSARESDRRLALAGMGCLRVAIARLSACLGLAMLVALVAFVVLWIDTGLDQPGRALLAILAFGLTYVGIGAIVGALVHDDLAGSLTVALIFLMDMYAGPGMSSSDGTASLTPTRNASNVLMAAAGGGAGDASDWIATVAIAVGALVLAFGAFWLSARPRT